MHGIYTGAAVIVLVGVLVILLRLIKGPTLMDRILAVNVIGTKTIVLLALVGFLYDRPGFFVDIALVYALINFIATIAMLKYVEGDARRRAERKAGRGG